MEKITVKEKNELYIFLKKNITGKSKNNIKSLLKNGCIFVNDKVITKYNFIVKENDIIEIKTTTKSNNDNLNIIYEDNNIIVIDKPTKILTIANKKEKDNTLYRMVSNYLKKQNKKVFIIHRLDYDTSGIIMFAKSEKIQKLYQNNWNKLAKLREYTAVVEGITDSKGHIESYLKQTKTLLVYSSKSKNGYFAITDYEKLKNNSNFSLLKIHITTGRRNQIRCHMYDIGHPIIGDFRYKSKYNPINRLALHANKLIITDPITNNDFIFTSNTPKEFISLFKK